MSGLGKAKKAKEHLEEGLEKVKAKPWAEPLGNALRISGKIAGAVEGLGCSRGKYHWGSSLIGGHPPKTRAVIRGFATRAEGS